MQELYTIRYSCMKNRPESTKMIKRLILVDLGFHDERHDDANHMSWWMITLKILLINKLFKLENYI